MNKFHKKSTHVDGNTEDWRKVIDVNVVALCVCTREAFNIMKENNIDGHIVHISSVAGHLIPRFPEPTFNIYPATKHAVRALTESLRLELCHLKTKIKVTVRNVIQIERTRF